MAGRPVRPATNRALSSAFSWKVTPVSTGSGRPRLPGGDKLRLSGVRAQILFENAADFNEFAFVVRSDDEFHGGPLFLTYGCA